MSDHDDEIPNARYEITEIFGDPREPFLRDMPTPIDAVTELNRRIAANTNPAHRYPNTNRRRDRWEDPIASRVTMPMIVDDPIAEIRQHDYRMLAIVALVVAIALAWLLLFVVAPKRAPRPCPLTGCAPTPTTLASFHDPFSGITYRFTP